LKSLSRASRLLNSGLAPLSCSAFGNREYTFPASRSEAEELNRMTRGWTFNEVNPVVCEGTNPQLPRTQNLPFFAAIDRNHPDTRRPLVGHVIEMLAVRRLERLVAAVARNLYSGSDLGGDLENLTAPGAFRAKIDPAPVLDQLGRTSWGGSVVSRRGAPPPFSVKR
jgi:hypothetical protein